MKKFKFIDITTADVAFLAYGKDLNELFENAALAMFEVMVNTKQVEQKVKREIKVKGNDLISLMFNWLNELLIYVDSENLAFSKFQVKVDESNFTLEAICEGEEINPEEFKLEITTFEELKARREVYKLLSEKIKSLPDEKRTLYEEARRYLLESGFEYTRKELEANLQNQLQSCH